MRKKNNIHSEYSQIAKENVKTYSFLAMLVNQRPDVTLVNNIKAMKLEYINQLGRESNLNTDIQEGLSEISKFVIQVKDQSPQTVEQALRIDWTRLFRGLQPGYGPKPPYEGVYLGENENDFKALESVAHFYTKHGVTPDLNARNRPDYIGLELDFLRYLCEKQADAWEKGEEKKAQQYQLAEHDFLIDHLGKWGGIFCDQVVKEAKTDFYRGFAFLTKGMIQEMADITYPISNN
jgi:TorA maturation chaperone TorD